MNRSFSITLPADTNYHNLYSLIVGTKYAVVHGGTAETGITGAIPVDGILPDRGCQLDIQADSTNTGTITIGDRNNANTGGPILTAGGNLTKRSHRNVICLKDYLIKGSVASQKINVVAEFL